MSVPTIDVITAFVNANKAFVGAKEVQVNTGTFVQWVQQATGNAPPDPWCASMQGKIGHAILGDKWPVPLTASCKAVGDWAQKNNVLETAPEVGALMLFYGENDSRGARFNHIGCVVKVIDSNTVQTIEGNTSEPSSRVRDGTGCFLKTRDIRSYDRFVMWWKVME